ncbi:MAG: RedB protein [Pirellulaceae bacterium]|nr:RedB protein [Pirellulaceae bacterium]
MSTEFNQPPRYDDHDADLRARSRPRGIAMSILVITWAAAVTGGLGVLWSYEHQPGWSHASPQKWPQTTQLIDAQNRPTLVMFVHPKCPCSRASIGELARIMTQCRDKMQTIAVYVKPRQCSGDPHWEQTDLWSSAAQIPGVTTVLDTDGVEAKRFGAETSGWCMLYDRDGHLQFSGGITPSRGHSGDNLGHSTIVSFLSRGTTDVHRAQVYGCDLETNMTQGANQCCQK